MENSIIGDGDKLFERVSLSVAVSTGRIVKSLFNSLFIDVASDRSVTDGIYFRERKL